MKGNGQLGEGSRDGQVLHWSGRVLSAEDLRGNLNGQRELHLSPRTIVTPMALDQLRAGGIRIVRATREEAPVGSTGTWGYAQERTDPQVSSAIGSLERDGVRLRELTAPRDEILCRWARSVAECIARGECLGGVVFCREPGLACCVANKLAGLRAMAVCNLPQAAQAAKGLAANFIAVEMPGRTFFEIRQILRLVCAPVYKCSEETAQVLKELDSHAHR